MKFLNEKNKDRLMLKKLSLIFMGLGLIFLVITIFICINRINFLNNSIKTQAKIIDYTISTTRDENGHYDRNIFPVFKFSDSEGKEYIVKSTITNNKGIKIGETTSIRYEKNNPLGAEINNIFAIWFGGIITAFFSLVWGVPGLIMLIMARKKQ